jgi:hypothetical protein
VLGIHDSDPRVLFPVEPTSTSPLLVDGCSLEFISPYEWPESDLSPNPVELPCACGELDVTGIITGKAVRLCAGLFDMGVDWEEPDLSLCQFDNLTQEICSATLVSF